MFMKKILRCALICACAVICVVGNSSAQQSGEEVSKQSSEIAGERLLRAMESELLALGCYEVKFGIETDGYSAAGRYVVAGKDFYLSAEGVEVYVTGGVKYEVNVAKREITIDGIESLGSDIVSNPTRGFTTLLKDYRAEETLVDGCRAVRLVPREAALSSESIVVVADTAARMPSKIVYASSEGAITVRLKSVGAWRDPLPRFEREKYPDYELIDFR